MWAAQPPGRDARLKETALTTCSEVAKQAFDAASALGFFDADDASSYKFAVNGHHHRMVGKRDISRDATDTRDWAFGAYHRRRLDLAKFVFGMTTDEDLRTMLEADPSSAAHVLGAFGFRDEPVLRKAPTPDQAPWPWCLLV